MVSAVRMGRRAVLGVALGMAAARTVPAQEGWPARPLRLIVPYAPGGGTDVLARSLAAKVAERIGVSIVVDNRPGGAGNLATRIAAEAAPDGHTLLVGNIGPIAVNPSLFPGLQPDPAEALAPVTLLAAAPMLMLVNPRVPARTLAELLDLARARPGALSYGSAGNGSANHLAGAYLALMAGIEMQHVPYRGAGPALNDLVSGTLDMMPASVPAALGLVRDGQVRALAVSTARRAGTLPDVPTVAEAGVPGYEMSAWYGIMVPARTPRPVVDRLQQEIAAALTAPELRARFEAEGAAPSGNTPEAFGAFAAAERRKWAEVVRAARIVPD